MTSIGRISTDVIGSKNLSEILVKDIGMIKQDWQEFIIDTLIRDVRSHNLSDFERYLTGCKVACQVLKHWRQSQFSWLIFSIDL